MRRLRKPWKNTTRGYSLIEFVIVLGVAGLILSAVWGVAGLMRNNVKQERFTEQLNYIAANMRGTYTGKAYIDSTLVSTMMPILTKLNVFPSDAILGVSGVSTVDSPFGEYTNPTLSTSPYKSLYVCGWRATGSSSCDFTSGTANVPLFAIEALIPAGNYCINAVMKNSNPVMLTGLIGVYVNGSPMPLPTPLSAAKTNCVAKSAITSTAAVVDFVFRLLPISGS